MKEKEQDDVPDFEEILGDNEESDTEDDDGEEETFSELDFTFDETYRGDPNWDLTQR
jgi:hypothetical protein